MDRVGKATTNHYRKGLADFVHDGLAAPPSVVRSGELSGVEAVAQLMTLHEDCLDRVRRRVPDFDGRVERFGADVVLTPLLGEIARHYGVPADEIQEGFALRDSPGAPYDRRSQPRLESGALDLSVLGPECDAALERHGWRTCVATIDAYATPSDPRLPLVRSRIVLRAEGLAWVSLPRVQTFQLARFEDLRVIHQQSDQWCLEFSDWRRRRIADRSDSPPWLDFVEQVRQVSVGAGFGWDVPSEGRRGVAYDSVIYNVSEWTAPARAALQRSLLDASVPHQWDGSDLVVPNAHEAKVDRIIAAL